MDKLILVDGLKLCFCIGCQTFHPCSEHFKDKKNKTGYSSRCKLNKKKYSRPPKPSKAEFVNEESEKMLSRLGYDTNSTIPIHQQFIIKHEL